MHDLYCSGIQNDALMGPTCGVLGIGRRDDTNGRIFFQPIRLLTSFYYGVKLSPPFVMRNRLK
jgi:hypothetical protein